MSLRFVIQEHDATNLHYDFRLEIDGVLRSWAVPKGPSMNPSEKRLALKVDDHSIDYIDFEGTIPEGQYGAGTVVIWDRGAFTLIEQKSDKIVFLLDGEKIKGGFSLIHLKGRGKGNQWLLIKKKDEYARTGWKLEPSFARKKKGS